MKKTPVVVKDGPGFLVNRILMPYLNEAGYLLEEGVSIKDLDSAALNFGMPMGPIELADTVGLDVCLAVAEILKQSTTCTVPELLKQKVSRKELGRK